MNKVECRRHIKTLVEQHREMLPIFSQKALEKLKTNAHFLVARRVLLFHSLKDEIQTHEFLSEVAKTKQIFLPVVRGEDMFLSEFVGEEMLRKGDFGIKEPQMPFYTGDIDVAVVPGVAFSTDGYRLGRGRGYYDRFLSQHPCYRIGLCFSFQCLDTIPYEEHDVLMDEVITD